MNTVIDVTPRLFDDGHGNLELVRQLDIDRAIHGCNEQSPLATIQMQVRLVVPKQFADPCS